MAVTVCGAGNSAQPVPAYGTIVSAGAAAIEEFLIGRGINRGAAIAVSGLLGGVTYDLLTICGQDPPNDPGMTAQDWLNALDYSQPLTQLPALAKVKDWFLRQYWYTVCECVGSATPPPPSISPPPNATQNPGIGPGPAAASCSGYLDTPFRPPAGLYARVLYDGTQLVLPPGAQSAAIQMFGVTSANLYEMTPNWLNSAGWTIQSDQQVNVSGPNGSAEWALPVPFGASQLQVTINNTGTGFLDLIRFDTAIYCTPGAPGSPVMPCCPPSPELEQLLQQILGLEQAIYSKLRPENYTYGAVHTGLTGSGTFPIVDLAGVSIQITSGVPTNPQLPGQPPYEWSVGWMSVSTPDGMIDEKRITRQQQVWLSGVTPYATLFGYYLNPGFTMNVTELLPV